MGLAENLLNQYKNNIASLNIIPSTGGVFEVTLDDELIFSKKELDRFPEANEIETIFREKM